MRYAPQTAFPPYAFLPGRDPHPTRDSKGHSYSEEPEPVEIHIDSDLWRTNVPFLYGVDLYNHGYLWEAHEAWESIWHPAKHDEQMANFLQGLIQCAAACLKIRMNQPAGLTKLSDLGLGRLERTAKEVGPTFMGVDLIAFTGEMSEFVRRAPESIDERPQIELLI